jgi:ABC-type glycerol-3-phosphate transport system permease component
VAKRVTEADREREARGGSVHLRVERVPAVVTLTSTAARRPVSAAIAFFTGSTQFQVPIGTISAATVVITVPLIILVVIFQKRIVAGLTAGAVKG